MFRSSPLAPIHARPEAPLPASRRTSAPARRKGDRAEKASWLIAAYVRELSREWR